jgi:hypothetical protein
MRRSTLGLLLFSATAFGAPCTTATTDCTEWLTFGGGPSRSLLYRTYPLEGRQKITRALIVIHGAGRDAHNYFRTAVAAAFLDGALEDTIVISPRFASSAGYAASIPDDQLTTYLLGELDILPLGGFDGSCPAMAQGPTRLARGQAFAKYVNEKFGAKHTSTVVPLCGHNARCMFTAEVALPILFPK